MKKYSILIIALVLAFLAASVSFADQPPKQKPKSLEGIEILTGFGSAKLRDKASYHFAPFLVSFNFSLKSLLEKINYKPKQIFQFLIEPFLSYVHQPDNNIETGTNFLLKVGLLPETSKFQPYIKAGVGMVYMTQHTREQGTQFNFSEQVGAGIHYFFWKNTAFTIEGRYRHVSNAGMRKPNKGLQSYFALVGISQQF